MKLKVLGLIISLTILIMGCSSSQVRLKPANDQLPAKVNLLPLESEVELSRETSLAIEESALAALRNRGFLVSRYSTSNAENMKIARVLIRIESFRRNTVFAGHVNVVSGNLAIYSPDNSLLADVAHTESERGGLLFNTGQIFKGLASEIDNFSDTAFGDWITRFSTKLIGTLPKVKLNLDDTIPKPPQIDDIQVKKVADKIKVCAKSSKGNNAFLLLKNTEFPMRYTDAESYCVQLPAFATEASGSAMARIKIVSPYDLSAIKSLNLSGDKNYCPELKVLAKQESDAIDFNVACTRNSDDLCNVNSCKQLTFRLYELQSDGTYLFSETFNISGLRRKNRLGSLMEQQFRIFMAGNDGYFQQPVNLEVVKSL